MRYVWAKDEVFFRFSFSAFGKVRLGQVIRWVASVFDTATPTTSLTHCPEKKNHVTVVGGIQSVNLLRRQLRGNLGFVLHKEKTI